MRHVLRFSGIAAAATLLLTQPAIAGQTKTTETKRFTVVSVDGNKLVARDSTGAHEYTVPADFRFMVNGAPVPVSDLKPGMVGTATITTTTTVKPVHVTEVKNGTVVQASGNSILVRGPEGFKMFTEGDVEKRGITIMKDGHKAEFTDLHTGDKLTATIITEGRPKVMTSRQVQATVAGNPAAAAAAGSTMASSSGGGTSASRSNAGTMASSSAGSSRRHLPKTASNTPLLAASGLLLLACALATSLARRLSL